MACIIIYRFGFIVIIFLLAAPRPEGRGSAPSGAFHHWSGAPHGRGITAQTPPPAPGRRGLTAC